MKVKTCDLIGDALNWVVTKIEAERKRFTIYPEFITDYATNWAQGGPIIEREKIELHCWDFHSMPWKAAMWWDDEDSSAEIQAYGPTPLIAAMRCYVASKLGDEVEIPEELMQ